MRNDKSGAVIGPSATESEDSSVNEPRQPVDYLPFVWQKLTTLDERLAQIAEQYGRTDAKLDQLSARVEQVEERLGKLDKTLVRASAAIAGAIALGSLLLGLYKLLEPHVSITLK